ncbi:MULTISPECIES: hypothetical protein [unclassified Microbacterium]|uniref:hypothetical protein n=1 Tax=unclassified Microbacterium TaxID=2609290 RepID=UPI0030163D12
MTPPDALTPSDAPGQPAASAPAAPPAPTSPAGPRVDVPSEDIAAAETSALPGEHRGGFRREMTEPVPITASVRTDAEWAAPPPATAALPRSAPWALFFGLSALAVSFVVGWGFPIGLVGIGFAIVALRRPWESRQMAVWALCLCLASLVYSAGWLWWASTQGPLFG